MTCRPPNATSRALLPAVLVALLVAGSLLVAAVPAGASAAAGDGSTLVVAVDADGDADVTLRTRVELGDGSNPELIERIERNASAVADRFRERLAGVAERTESETGRPMRVSDATAHVAIQNSTATVELSATWEGLAAAEGDRLVLTEPFASGFDPAQRFVVRVPEGYALASATPTSGKLSDGAVAWPDGADFDGFRVEFAPEDRVDGAETAAGPMPGFGLAAGLVALLAIGALGRSGSRRRS